MSWKCRVGSGVRAAEKSQDVSRDCVAGTCDSEGARASMLFSVLTDTREASVLSFFWT